MERARGMGYMGKRATHRLVLSAALAGALAALGADVTIFGQAGTAGTIRFNDGAPSAHAQISVVDGARVRVVAEADAEHAFSHWTGDVDAVCEGDVFQPDLVVAARDGLSLTAVFGLRNRQDAGDTRPHGYLDRFSQKADGMWSALWTDGDWTKRADWWSDGYVPTNRNDVLHFLDVEQPDELFHAWIDWPSGDWHLGTVADSSPQSKFILNSGWGRYLYIQNQENSHARWQNRLNTTGGFGTTDENTPHRINRAWTSMALGVNAVKAGHEIVLHELSGGGYVRKVGPGRLTLEQPSAGGLRLEEGCVALGSVDTAASYVPGAYGRYDAAAQDTMDWAVAPDGKKRLTAWRDVGGTRDQNGNLVRLMAPYICRQTGWTNIWYGPVRGTKTVCGVPLLDFGAYTRGATAAGGGTLVDDAVYPGERAVLGAGAGLNVGSAYQGVRTVFMAFEFPSRGGTQSPVSYWNGLDVPTMVVRADGDGLLTTRDDAFKFRGAFYENGAPVKGDVGLIHGFRDGHAFTVLAGCVTNNGPAMAFWHMGLQPGARYAGGIRVAEVLVYTNSLSEAEVARNNLAMQRKWHDRAVHDVYPWSLDYLFLCNENAAAEIRVDGGRTAAIRTVHRPAWTGLAGRPLVKTGDGVLELDRCSTNLDVVVKGGSLRFIRETAQIAEDPCPAPFPYFWGDAAETNRFVFAPNSTSNIVCWLDRRADVPHALTNWVETARFATLNADGLHGLPCVDFGTAFDSAGARLALTSATNQNGHVDGYSRNVVDGFVVWRNIAPAGVNPFIFADTAAGNSTFRRTWKSLVPWLGEGRDYTFNLELYTALWRVDGRLMHPENEFADRGRDDYIVVRCRGHHKLCINQLGGLHHSQPGGGCQIAEVLFYDYALSDFAARQTEAYLLKKWKGARHPDACSEEDRLGSLVFDGAKPVLETASDRTFGRIAGTGTLVKTGAGTATVGAVEGFSGVEVRAGAFAYAAGGALPTALAFTLPKEGTDRPQMTAAGALDLGAVESVRVDVEGGERPVHGRYPLVAADAFTGDVRNVEVLSNVKARVAVTLVVRDGRLFVAFAPKGAVLVFR